MSVVNEYSASDSRLVDDRHNPVIRTRKVAVLVADLPLGTIVALNGTDEVVMYDPDGAAPTNTPIGVVRRTAIVGAEAVDVIEHGCVYADALLVEGSAADATAMAALEDATIIFVTRD